MSITFNINLDSSTNTAPAGFFEGLAAAITFYKNSFTTLTPVTINLTVKWEALGALDLGINHPTFVQVGSYSTLHNLLPNSSSVDPSGGGGTYVIPNSEAKVLGLPTNGLTSDGTMSFNSTQPWAFDRTQLTSGVYDFVGTAEHEISEIMGRMAGLGRTLPAPSGFYLNSYTALDLYRYSALGKHRTMSA